MFSPDRRGALAGLAVLALLPRVFAPARAATSRDAGLVALLDRIDAGDPVAGLGALRGFDARGLSPVRRLDLLAVRQGLAVDARMLARWNWLRPGRSPYPVSPRTGNWRKVAEGGTVAADAIRADTQMLDAAANQGVVLPRALLDETLRAVEAARGRASGESAAALAGQAAALRKQRPHAPDHAGLVRLRGGSDYFALMLERALGEAIAPAAAHARAEAAARALARRADMLFAKLGMKGGSNGERFRALARDPRHLYADSGAGRDRAVADMNRWMARARRWMPQAFGTIPPAVDHVAARRMSRADEAAGRGGYRTVPPADGSGEGGYYVDLAHIRRRPDWTLSSVVHHELLPGHMLQMPIEAAADPHPLRLSYAAAFTEGWAIYAEELMAHAGAFEGAPEAELGYIQWALFRVGRALADTGIHSRGWTQAQAIARLRDLQGEGVIFAPIEEDVARICLEPGIRSAEFLMAASLADLRDIAGDVRDFHDHVLAPGSLPLHLVEAVARHDGAGTAVPTTYSGRGGAA
ncbi:DUF885 family protein [Stakelama saccharophila]|uniref:DUF885 family protein n=1 Tax=Stakelama saccharophila TaxID=3075605 RepID=A0ABZ0BBU1_9SPHN|nr:DUF885 family protein [Stakelama sp. W311]WNO54823.1 DUF885 family protein [Stakelama sp. W311]